jgi:hypothetical protein
MRRALALALVGLAAAGAAAAQPKPDADLAFIDSLRREDPATAERFVALRDARNAAIADLERAGQRYSAGGSALQPITLPELKKARRRYAETSLALLDFLDERDRAGIARLQRQIESVNHALEERRRDREELEKLRATP